MQSSYAWPTLFFGTLALVSIGADWWRHRRRDHDRLLGRAGWVPWPIITILALILAAFGAALWLGDR